MERIELTRGGWLELDRAFVAEPEASALFTRLFQTLAWAQRSIRMFGRALPEPRLTAWYGDPGAHYTYSGLSLAPLAWTPELADLRARVASRTGVDFDSVLANLYRDGRDSMGLHADDEPELGPSPVIASLSFGTGRRFELVSRAKDGPREKLRVELGHGCLLVMAGTTQHHYKHGVPKQPSVTGPRINLTFRRVHAALTLRG